MSGALASGMQLVKFVDCWRTPPSADCVAQCSLYVPEVALPGLAQEAYAASAPESVGDPEEVPELDPELPDELPLELPEELPGELPEEPLLEVDSVSLASLGPVLFELLLEQAARAMSKIDAALLVNAIRRSVIR